MALLQACIAYLWTIIYLWLHATSQFFEIKSDFTMSCIDHLDFYVLIVLSAWELVRNREGPVIQFRNNRSQISCNDLLRSIWAVHVDDSFEKIIGPEVNSWAGMF